MQLSANSRSVALTKDQFLTDEIRALCARVELLRKQSESLWRWDTKRLHDAREELSGYLHMFCFDLDHSPVFSKMPRLGGRFEYLWASFLEEGEPGTPAYEGVWPAERSIHGLALPYLFVVLGVAEAEDATELLMLHVVHRTKGNEDEARYWLDTAAASVASGERAIAFATEQLATAGKEIILS